LRRFTGVCFRQSHREVYGGTSNLDKVYHGVATVVTTVDNEQLILLV
jgi:hypothetical protein